MYKRVQHFGVYGLIMHNNKVLLVQKSRGPYEDLWDLPGGRIEFGETPDTALIREIMEETGLEIESYHFLKTDACVVNYKNDQGDQETLHHVGFIYQVNVKDVTALTIIGDEEDTKAADWFDIIQVDYQDFSPFVQELLMDWPLA